MIQNRNIRFTLLASMLVLFYSCTTKHIDSGWKIRSKGNTINIKAGILQQNIIISDTNFVTSAMSVSDKNILNTPSEEITFIIHKAFPNKEPVGVEYSSDAGVEQSNAVKNKTDALDVKMKRSKTLQEVQWIDSLSISKENFSKVFSKSNSNLSETKEGVKRLTLTFLSDGFLKGVVLKINYEIYAGFPVIRKWITVKNKGNEWFKISDLTLQKLNLNNSLLQTTQLTPSSRGIDPSMIAFSDTVASFGVISASEIPSKLRHLSVDGTNGYNSELFEWVIGPAESFESEPIFNYAFAGESYSTASSVSTALDRCVEGDFHSFLDDYILMPVGNDKNIAPVFCTWTNYNANINDSNMHVAANIASHIGFKCFQLDAGWSNTGPNGGWAVSTPTPNLQNFTDLKGLSTHIRSKNMKTGLWYSIFINEKHAGNPGSEPVLYSLPLVRRAGGLGLSLCYDKSREQYVNDIVYLHNTYEATYFKQDLSNVCYGDIARGHDSRTLKESYLRGLRGLFATQDEIHRQAPDVWLQLSHEIYWETPGPEADIAVLKHADSYHSAPNEYWGAGKRQELVNPCWNYDVNVLQQKLRHGAFRARTLWYAHRGLPLNRIEVFGAVTTNFKGSLSSEILDRQICSWLMGSPISYSGDLTSLTPDNIEQYRNRFAMLKRLDQQYHIYSHFQYSGVPAPSDENWHWWGKLNSEGCGAVVILRGSEGEYTRRINIPWVKAENKYRLKLLFAEKDLGVFSGEQLQNGELKFSLEKFGQEIIEISEKETNEKQD